jgi:hypothetical protein
MNEHSAGQRFAEISSKNDGGLEFPFERDQDYPIQELKEFEAALLRTRQSDLALSKRLRTPTDPEWPWIKLRHEELIPLLYCVEHRKVAESALFRIMPEGNPVDLLVRAGGVDIRLQVTIADPVWGSGRKGSQHHLKVEWGNTGEIVNGFGPYKRKDQTITGPDRMKSGEELDHAYGGGLRQALDRKAVKDGRDQTLVIYCREYSQVMDAKRFHRLTAHANACGKMTNFAHVWFVDSGESFFVEF